MTTVRTPADKIFSLCISTCRCMLAIMGGSGNTVQRVRQWDRVLWEARHVHWIWLVHCVLWVQFVLPVGRDCLVDVITMVPAMTHVQTVRLGTCDLYCHSLNPQPNLLRPWHGRPLPTACATEALCAVLFAKKLMSCDAFGIFHVCAGKIQPRPLHA